LIKSNAKVNVAVVPNRQIPIRVAQDRLNIRWWVDPTLADAEAATDLVLFYLDD